MLDAIALGHGTGLSFAVHRENLYTIKLQEGVVAHRLVLVEQRSAIIIPDDDKLESYAE